jgi:hypothetical protein
MPDVIPLRWIKNTAEYAEKCFGEGKTPFTYCEAPIQADFTLTYENLAPYVTKILDKAAPLEGAGLYVRLIEIKDGKVLVW